jgi:hypothetical protein
MSGRSQPSRVLVVAPRGVLTHVAGVLFELHSMGVELVFASKTRHVERVRLPNGLLERGGVSVVRFPLRRLGTNAEAVKAVRLLADYVRFLGPNLRTAEYPRSRISGRLRALGLSGATEQAPALSGAQHAWLRQALGDVERLVEPQPELEDAVARLQPDGILLVTRCSFGGPEPDVIKVARRLGLPSIMLVWSWDNLSSKSVLHEHPDHVLVWNDIQRTEAIELHGIAPEQVSVVGAPNFDRFFEEVESIPNRSTRAREPATIVYLGSSPNVAPDEPVIFDRWLEAVRASGDPTLQHASIVARPHPASVDRWRAWSAPRGVSVDEPRAKVDQPALARILSEADVAVALNTSAEIEAAIAGCPVVTFRAGPDAPGQEGSLHFSYLLSAEGGFALDASSLDDHVSRLAAVLSGEYDHGELPRFVQRFVRPGGLAVPVSPVVAATVLDLIDARRPVTAGA